MSNNKKKTNEIKQHVELPDQKPEIDLEEWENEQWENEQLDIFSDIIISILFKENIKNIKNEQ
jgi:hypothetical protein